jgi:signal transduction histidine kinase
MSGTACRIIGAMHDISKQQALEDRLEREMRTRQQQVEGAAEDAKEMERSNIGKELHDNVNQLLGVSRLYLDLAQKGGDESEDFMKKSSEYTLTAIEEIRKLTKGLTTDVIENLGLRHAIKNIASETMQLQKIRITCTTASFMEDSVDNKFKLNIFRMVQEQLNNILKHSKATEVSILLAQEKNKIVLDIKDNGVGFDLSKKRDGIGIDNIRDRAGTFNGKTEIISAKGKGCRLISTFAVK